MSRTTCDLVKGILLDDYGPKRDGTDPDLSPFIDSASSLVDDVVECASDKDVVISSSKRELLERWLAAHLYVMSDQPYSEKKTEKASGVFQGKTGMGLEASKYGQTAVLLDPSGCLAAIGKQYRVGMTWLGKTDTEKVDYDRRN